MEKIILINPSGNMTAVLEGFKTKQSRITKTENIFKRGRAEQVAYVMKPKLKGDCKIQMMADEFCANAVRGYGYYYFKENSKADSGIVNVEINSNDKPLEVYVDTNSNSSFVKMPHISPSSYREVKITLDGKDVILPFVKLKGIDHVIYRIDENDKKMISVFKKKYKTDSKVKDIINQIVSNSKFKNSKAIGIMFVIENKIFPYVEVKDLNTKIWESSCGSGTTAYFAYLLQTIINKKMYKASNTNTLINGIYRKVGDLYSYEKTYIEPGGKIILKGYIKNDKIKEIQMGGNVSYEIKNR